MKASAPARRQFADCAPSGQTRKLPLSQTMSQSNDLVDATVY